MNRLHPDDIEAIAEAVIRKLDRQQGINLDAAYLASLSKEEYDRIINPRFWADRSTRKKKVAA